MAVLPGGEKKSGRGVITRRPYYRISGQKAGFHCNFEKTQVHLG